jgi:hypothetical protein
MVDLVSASLHRIAYLSAEDVLTVAVLAARDVLVWGVNGSTQSHVFTTQRLMRRWQ